MERYFQIGRINLKYNLFPHLLLSVVFLLISPFLMGVKNLDSSSSAKVLEMYVALTGIILLTPVFLPEQNKDIRDLVEAKYTSATAVILLRILEAGICLVILTGIYVMQLKNNNCSFPQLKYYLGTLAEAIFLGGMGLCAYSIFDQIAIAYMVPMMYYILAIGGGKKVLGNFYLFSMMYGGYQEKVNLAMIGLLLIVTGILYPYVIKRFFIKLYNHKMI